MKSRINTLVKSISIALTLAGILVFVQGQAQAGEVTVTGFYRPRYSPRAPVKFHR